MWPLIRIISDKSNGGHTFGTTRSNRFSETILTVVAPSDLEKKKRRHYWKCTKELILPRTLVDLDLIHFCQNKAIFNLFRKSIYVNAVRFCIEWPENSFFSQHVNADKKSRVWYHVPPPNMMFTCDLLYSHIEVHAWSPIAPPRTAQDCVTSHILQCHHAWPWLPEPNIYVRMRALKCRVQDNQGHLWWTCNI